MKTTQRTQHEKRVAQEKARRISRIIADEEEMDVEETSYEEEVGAERSGTAAEEVQRQDEEEPTGEAARWSIG